MSSETFTTITIQVISNSDYKFMRYIGFATQNFFFKTIAKIDKNLAEKLHNQPGIKPYSITTLFQDEKPIYTTTKAGQPYWFKITLLDEKYSNLTLKLIEKISNKIELDINKFTTISCNIKITPYQKLLEKTLNNKFTIKFLTPTCFKTPTVYIKRISGTAEKSQYKVKRKKSTAYYPLPDPQLMIRNLLRIWKKHSKTPLPYNQIETTIAEDQIYIHEYPNGIKTKWAREGSRKNQQGFTGTVTYGVKDEVNLQTRKAIAALLQLGEQTGTGIMRTAGLGTYKIIKGIIDNND